MYHSYLSTISVLTGWLISMSLDVSHRNSKSRFSLTTLSPNDILPHLQSWYQAIRSILLSHHLPAFIPHSEGTAPVSTRSHPFLQVAARLLPFVPGASSLEMRHGTTYQNGVVNGKENSRMYLSLEKKHAFVQARITKV